MRKPLEILWKIIFSKSNALFLDRDGVINRQIENGYVTDWDDFVFLPNVLEALSILNEYFTRIFIVTNQRGIAKGLYSEYDLLEIHEKMMRKITESSGRIDHIYFCPHDIGENCNCRKPKPGMAYQAKKDYPEIDFTMSIMVGDTLSDMEFGKTLDMFTVFVGVEKSVGDISDGLINLRFDSLFSFAFYLRKFFSKL